MKICFLGAGSTVFAKNVLGDCIRTLELVNFEIALHDIDEKRLKESYTVVSAVNRKYGSPATIHMYLDRKESLKDADYIINAVQIGGYEPCTVADFEIPKKYGLRQTIADTLGVGGIFRALRTIAVLEDFAKDIEEVCPNALFLNYTNPMAMLTGYMLNYTKVNIVGLCHSVQVCVPHLFQMLQMSDKLEGATYKIGGINHQAWLLEIKDKDGVDLYPEIKKRSKSGDYRLAIYVIMPDLVRHDMMHNFGCYITESSEHASEYLPYYIKNRCPELIEEFKIPLDEYPRRCRWQIRLWKLQRFKLMFKRKQKHNKSKEYGSRIIQGAHTNKKYSFGGSMLNDKKTISNLPPYACIEVPMTVDANGFAAEDFGRIPDEQAALNRTNINPQEMAIRAAKERRMDYVYMAVALDPHTSSEMLLEDIIKMCDELYDFHHGDGWMPEYVKA